MHEIEAVGAPYKAFILEDVAPRPLTDLPAAIAADMEQSQVSILAVHVQRNELKSRMQLTDIVNRRKMRHGHMVNINRQMMLEGMRADFHKVDRLSQKVIDIVRTAKEVRATTRGGSNFVATLNPDYKWIKTSGLISPDKWGNLPGGEVFTTPGNVDGTLVIDGVVGDFLCEKFGSLQQTPLTLRVKDNRLVEAHSENKELENDFWNYTHTDENSDRVGEFAIGTNIELTAGDRPHPAGREVPRHSRGLRRSLRRPHRRQVVLVDAHRRGGDALRHLGGRPADHGRRQVSDRIGIRRGGSLDPPDSSDPDLSTIVQRTVD